eukprot:4083676-Prorocentrum_lima.AAC.1
MAAPANVDIAAPTTSSFSEPSGATPVMWMLHPTNVVQPTGCAFSRWIQQCPEGEPQHRSCSCF